MINHGKRNVLGIGISAIDYEAAVDAIIDAAHNDRSFKVSALAVHGVMTGVLDPVHRWRLNNFDVVAPDGQPVRWALNALYGAGLQNRVYGPTLMLSVCQRAAEEDLPIYLYGSRPEVLAPLADNLMQQFPGLRIGGTRPSLFRRSTEAEKHSIAREIADSGSKIVFVGLGCPRQEVWVHEYAAVLPRPAIAVGAAFDFHAGLLKQAPAWMQDAGMEWIYRLAQEPRRLWRRYLLLNPLYLTLFATQAIRPTAFADQGIEPQTSEDYA
ncbi:MAG: WecB/TagA/CpsF family glycosyltransferase [Pseudomonadota bacterium]